MNSVAKIALIGAGFITSREVWLTLYVRRANRRALFLMAQKRSSQTGKPLVVIGDPDAGTVNSKIGRDYDCGNFCVDLYGCKACPNQVAADLLAWLKEQPDNSAVLFVSAVLEYIQSMNGIPRELYRVSGGDLFVVTVEPFSYTAFFYQGAKRQFFSAPPHGPFKWQEFRG